MAFYLLVPMVRNCAFFSWALRWALAFHGDPFTMVLALADDQPTVLGWGMRRAFMA